ncbi:MAG: EAL domain-containing protein [Pseudomonadota bacterium]|nr:EAL domain-containing protein [Pseudomonadota bacterium]
MTGRDIPDAAVRQCVFDGDGRLVELDGAARGAAAMRRLDELLPGIDLDAVRHCCAALDAIPEGTLRLDAGPSASGAESLVLSRVEGPPVRYHAQWSAMEAGGYRDRLEQRLAFERLIAALSTELIHAPAEQLDVLIEQALGRIGGLFDVDRAYLFRFSSDRATQSNTHEWVAEGISREAQHLQDVPIGYFPWLMEQVLAGQPVHVPVVADLPDSAVTEHEEFTRQGILSLVLVPFGDPGQAEGFIGFDSVRRQRHWQGEILLGLQLVGQMFFNAFRARAMSARLTRLAFHDPLTGMGNRRFLGERLAHALELCQQEGGQLAVLLIDLDDFKLVNDSYGHSLGDEILETAASRLASTVRATDIVARLGGDEFVVVARTADLDALSQLVGRLFDAMLEPAQVRGVTFALRMSVGIALFPDDGVDAETLLRQADSAMYAAKLEGKNRFAFFTPEMTRDSRTALQLRHELRLAIERGEIQPYYQPRVELPSMRVLGFEALARWHHPERGVLLPAEFLGLARQSGLIGCIDLGITTQALGDLAQWRRQHPACRMSINLDADDLFDESLIGRLEEVLGGASAAADGVEIEITESSLMRDIERASATLARLRQAAPALQIAIDDFGSGYSSLSYLGRLPVTTLKIDRSFTAELGSANPRSARAIIHSIIDLGRSLGLHVVAEGVETVEQAAQLVELGCVEAQGFLFSHAVPAAVAATLLEHGLGPTPPLQSSSASRAPEPAV